MSKAIRSSDSRRADSSFLPSYVFAGDMAAMSASPSADLSPLAAMAAREHHSEVNSSSATNSAVSSTYASYSPITEYSPSSYLGMPSSSSSSTSSAASWLTTPLVVVDKKSSSSSSSSSSGSRKSSLIPVEAAAGSRRSSAIAGADLTRDPCDLRTGGDHVTAQHQKPGWLAQKLGATVSWNSGAVGDNNKDKKDKKHRQNSGVLEEESEANQADLQQRMSSLNSAVGKMRASLRDMNAVAPSNF